MEDSLEPKIAEAEQIDNGVYVRFIGGKSALYPALLLYSAVELSEVMNEAKIEKENSRLEPGA